MDYAQAKALVLAKYPDAFPWDIMGDSIGISSHIAGGCIGLTLDRDEGEAWIDAAAKIAKGANMDDLVKRLRELCERHHGVTPGPWRWVWSEQAKRIVIQGGKTTYDLTVVDFVRYGMSQAAPRFREDVDRMNIMHRADHWGAVVPGREHHASWFKTLDHPDANLIADAPTLLAALREAADEIERLTAERDDLRKQWQAEQHVVEVLRRDAERLRAKCKRQLRELRRLNKYLGPYWAGFSKGLNMAAETKLRGIMNAAFGHAAVRAAERAAIDAAMKAGEA